MFGGKGKIIQIIFTVFLAVLAVVTFGAEPQNEEFLFAEISADGSTHRISCFQGKDAQYYFFLPSYADLSQIQLHVPKNHTYALDGRNITDGENCRQMIPDKSYPFWKDGVQIGELTFVCSGNIGTVFVDTTSGSMEQIHESKTHKETGKMLVYSDDGQLRYAGNLLSVKSRGNSTWAQQKKSYSLELPTAADLLGVGSAEKWILLANALDNSNLRNKIVYDFAKDFSMDYSPDCDWVDLYLNGEYAGMYLLSERNEVHPQRVDISRNGSFLLCRDSDYSMERQGIPYVLTQAQAALRIHYADMDEETLKAILQSAENAILAEDGIDPLTGKRWDQLIDPESWANKYLIEEVFGNVDGTAYSQFYYYDGEDPSGRIYAGPVWDYDLSMSLGNGSQENVQRFYANIPDFPGALWPNALYQKEGFYQRVTETYERQLKPLLRYYMEEVIPEYAERIAEAGRMNGLRWNRTYTEESAEAIVQFLELRLAFLDSVWLENKEYCYICVLDDRWERFYYAVKKGSLPPTRLDRKSGDSAYEYRWYVLNTDERFFLDQPLYEDVSICLRLEPVEVQLTEEYLPENDVASTEPMEETELNEEKIPPARLMPLLIFVGILGLFFLTDCCRIFRQSRR